MQIVMTKETSFQEKSEEIIYHFVRFERSSPWMPWWVIKKVMPMSLAAMKAQSSGGMSLFFTIDNTHIYKIP